MNQESDNFKPIGDAIATGISVGWVFSELIPAVIVILNGIYIGIRVYDLIMEKWRKRHDPK